LGEALPEQVRAAASKRAGVRLAVGISDSLAKLVVKRLLQPIIHEPDMRLLCMEKEFDDLLADLALHRLDVVLTDRMPAPNPSIKLYGHSLGSSPVAWYAPEPLFERAIHGFPHSLLDVPVLLPTPHASVRGRLDQWFDRVGVSPHVVGEFHDSALLATFGAAGMGVFPAAQWVHDKMLSRYQLQCVGVSEGVEERFYALGTEKRIQHPLVQRLLLAHAQA
jgi:LysR family transcriptional activator of nhaA